jgi:hypothetical protein
MRYIPKTIEVEARQFTLELAEEMSSIEAWSNGSVRNTRLPAAARQLKFTDKSGEYYYANVGDWIIKHENGEREMMSNSEFKRRYDKV